MTDDPRVWGAVMGLVVVFGNKLLDSAFKVLDRIIDHKLDQMEDDDDPKP